MTQMGVGADSSKKGAKTTTAGSDFVIARHVLDFGHVVSGSSRTLKFKVTNPQVSLRHRDSGFLWICGLDSHEFVWCYAPLPSVSVRAPYASPGLRWSDSSRLTHERSIRPVDMAMYTYTPHVSVRSL
jgi:hypothetical protein